MYYNGMFIMVGVISVLAITVITAKRLLSIRFKNEVNKLFSESICLSDKIFSSEQIAGLPEPVQRYFKFALKEGQSYISSARLTHGGQLKTSQKSKWVNISGEEYFTTATPGFIWKGKTSTFTAVDRYSGDKGALVVFLFGVFKIAGGEGEKYNEGELLRWLSESVWFPTNLLPNQYLQWSEIDNSSAKLTFNYKQLSVSYVVTFNAAGEITQMETKRYYGDGQRETWIGKFAAYKEVNQILLPTTVEASYVLNNTDFPYARFNVEKIMYDNKVMV